MNRQVRFLTLLLVAPACFAENSLPRNPDQWSTLEFSQGALSTLHGDLTVHGKIANAKDALKNQNINAGGVVMLPLWDAWTLQAGAGIIWAEQDVIPSSSTVGGTASTSKIANGTVSVRHYFEGRGAALGCAPKNPDRWPSLSLSAGGAKTLQYSAGNATGPIDKNFVSSNESLSLEFRAPVSDAWSVTATIGDQRSVSKSDPAPSANGVETRGDSISVNAGVRWFLIGKNMIQDDSGKNPDRWSMIFLTGGANKGASGRQTITNLAGVRSRRDMESRGASLSLGARIPITNHFSLRFETAGAYSRNSAPIIPLQNGFRNRLETITFTTAVRYFIF